MNYYSESGLELRYGTEDSAGLDLPFYDPELEEFVLMPGQQFGFKTGIYPEIPVGHVGILDNRSSTGKVGLDLMCRIIDADFRGNIKAMLRNHSEEPVVIRRGQYLTQMVVVPYYKAKKLNRVSSPDQLTPTARGKGEFGSTGKGLSK